MELWDAYKADGTLAGFDIVRGENIPENYYHLVCEAVIQHTDAIKLLQAISNNSWRLGVHYCWFGNNSYNAIER